MQPWAEFDTIQSDSKATAQFTLAVRLTGWDCASDCKYRCMRTIVRVRAVEGLNTAKYYGKWSLERVLGVQGVGRKVGLENYSAGEGELVARVTCANSR